MHIQSYNSVIPVKTGIHFFKIIKFNLDSRFHGNDRVKDTRK